jgi:hypothetical protein
MEFFRVAHEYQFESAKVNPTTPLSELTLTFGCVQEGVKKMLHLIWTKDNNTSTSEDGQQLKGIRQRLLECYRNLYFEPIAGLDPKEQVNRITKNLIEYVQISISFLLMAFEGIFPQTYIRCNSGRTDQSGRDDAHHDGGESDPSGRHYQIVAGIQYVKRTSAHHDVLSDSLQARRSNYQNHSDVARSLSLECLPSPEGVL